MMDVMNKRLLTGLTSANSPTRKNPLSNSYKKKIMTWCCNLLFSWVNSSGYKSLTMCWTKLPGPLVEWYLFFSWLCGILFCSGRCNKWLTDGWLLPCNITASLANSSMHTNYSRACRHYYTSTTGTYSINCAINTNFQTR
jgi:hypothetical protein